VDNQDVRTMANGKLTQNLNDKEAVKKGKSKNGRNKSETLKRGREIYSGRGTLEGKGLFRLHR